MSGLCISAAIVTWIAAMLAAGCCLLPFWLASDIGVIKLATGLYLTCSNPYENNLGNCQFLDLSNAEDWFKACAFMWAIGSAFLLFSAIGIFGLCCCGRGISVVLAFMSGLGGLLLCATIILYGVKMGNLFNRSNIYYDWSFYLSWLANIMAFVSAGLFVGVKKEKPINEKINPL